MQDRLAILSERHGRMQMILILLFSGDITLDAAAQAFLEMEQNLPYDLPNDSPSGPVATL